MARVKRRASRGSKTLSRRFLKLTLGPRRFVALLFRAISRSSDSARNQRGSKRSSGFGEKLVPWPQPFPFLSSLSLSLG